MWATITRPFAWLMLKLYDWTGNYGVALILFGLTVNLILTPFMAKSKKSTMQSTRLQPRIQELQTRHAGNQQKLNEEMQKLYREEGINPMSGCLWSLIPFPILIALYSVIRQPLTRMMFITSEAVTALQEFFVKSGWYTIPEKADAYFEIKLAGVLHEHWAELQNAIAAGEETLAKVDLTRLHDVDFHFLGMDLGSVPDFRFWNFDWSSKEKWLPAVGLFLIPVIATVLSWAQMKVGNLGTPQQDNQAAASMKTMTMTMPLMSLWFCFIMPAAMGIYWTSNSVFGMIRDYFMTKLFKKQLDEEEAERIAARKERDRDLELKRLETERKHAEGTNEKNTNTSKKKIQANEKQKSNERKAALEREDRAARREMLGIEDAEVPASQVGSRRYARGRAYDPDRFKLPGESSSAEEATVEDAAAEAVAEPAENNEIEEVKEET